MKPSELREAIAKEVMLSAVEWMKLLKELAENDIEITDDHIGEIAATKTDAILDAVIASLPHYVQDMNHDRANYYQEIIRFLQSAKSNKGAE